MTNSLRLRVAAAVLSLFIFAPATAAWAADAPTSMPAYRVDTRDFDASEADIRAVCDSAGMSLWRHFPDYKVEPFVVTRGRSGPIVLFQRNDRKEIVLRLDTGNTLWSQYAYQFAHEFCHILCGFRDGDASNKWFEETLCETASLYAMREMAKSWKEKPPYRNWADYRDSLRSYADDVVLKRKGVETILRRGLAAYYLEHEAELRKKATDRELNGSMAVVLLRLFEQDPTRWEAVRWLNAEPAPSGETFEAYLTRWHEAAPERHRAFVDEVRSSFGLQAPEAGIKK